MAYWWVSQNKTFKHERAGGFIWAPLVDRRGGVPHHWRNVGLVKQGDTIFSYFRGKIVATSKAISDAYPEAKPAGLDVEQLWEGDGQRVDVTYRDLRDPIVVRDIAVQLAQYLPKKYSPLTSQFSGVQGYLFALSDDAGEFLETRTARTRMA